MRQIFFFFVLTRFCVCVQAQPFVEVSALNGLNMGYGAGEFGGGISFCDFNGDGWDDLTFASQKQDGLYFFVNQNGTLQPIPALVDYKEETKQVLWVDYDNDGDKDLFVTAFDAPSRLYRNDGNLQMTDVTQAAGLGLTSRQTFGATFGDYNNDGWLDLYIVNRFITLYGNYLYENQGDGTFLDVSGLAGVANGFKPSFCASFLDINDDGWQDLYIAQDRYMFSNDLYLNLGNETFEDISQSSFTDIAIDAMNVGVGDYDRDGDQDIYVTNTALGNVLLRNEGDLTFSEVAVQCGVALNQVSWGGNFFDYDLDGHLDLYVNTNGADAPNVLYRNDGNGAFEAPLTLEGDLGNSFCNAIGDLDRDGRPDIAVSNMGGASFRLWQNQTENDNNWIAIRLRGTLSNRDGIGSWIEVFAGGQKVTRYTHCGIAYLAQNSDRELIGLGTASAIDSIKVRWLSGVVDTRYNVSVNQTITILEQSTGPNNTSSAGKAAGLQIERAWFTQGGLHLFIGSNTFEKGQLLLTDAAGRHIKRWPLEVHAGKTQRTFPLNPLAPGMYFLVLYGNEQMVSYRLVKGI